MMRGDGGQRGRRPSSRWDGGVGGGGVWHLSIAIFMVVGYCMLCSLFTGNIY